MGGRRTSSASKRKTPSSSSSSSSSSGFFLAKLARLREFVADSSVVDDDDLSNCLRLCGHDVELAALQLMTGEYKKTKTASKGTSAFFAMTAKKQKPSRPLEAKKKPPPKVPSKQQNTADGRFLLCRRWTLGLSTTKRGLVRYQERLIVSASTPPIVRFKGNSVEGTLQTPIGRMLAPLLCLEASVLVVTAESLMEQQHNSIGQEVPLSISVFITDPHAFFSLFDGRDDGEASSASMFFGAMDRKKPSRFRKTEHGSVSDAAFSLLQWAQHGEEYLAEHLTTTTKPASEDDESQQDEKKDAAWTDGVVENSHANLVEAPDPNGLRKGVVLRPYQRQALQWMMNRESKREDRSIVEKEMELLSELAKNKTIHTDAEGDISCDRGPVRVSAECARNSKTIYGQVNPVNHPLWKKRFLATDGMKTAVLFYVNELTQVASLSPPNPPQHCTGGILADAMGLGKTVMLLSLILNTRQMAHEQSPRSDPDGFPIETTQTERPSYRTTLVVAPLTLISQWEEELATKTNLTHELYYDKNAKRRNIGRDCFAGIDVVVTTYGMVKRELNEESNGSSNGLLSYDWHRVILDEAHCVKNPSTSMAKACCMLKGERRWCVTGTPIQNSLKDVYALVKFLKHEPWCESGFWKAAILGVMNQEDGMILAMDRVRRLLAPLILRRTKDSLDKNGNPIIKLPPIETKIINVEFTTAERQFYNALKARSQVVFEGFIKAGTASKSFFAIFSLLNKLRQTCDHLALTVKSHMDESEWNSATGETAPPDQQGGVNHEFIQELLEKFRQEGAKKDLVFETSVAETLHQAVQSDASTIPQECPICLETLRMEDAVITPCAHMFCRKCLMGYLKDGGACPCCNKSIETKHVVTLPTTPARQTLQKAVQGSGSSKLSAIMDELDRVWEQEPDSKVLIFSQFLGFLDLIGSSMDKKSIPHLRLDGNMAWKERVAILRAFAGSKRVLLVSMKAGGVGINLVAANTVFIADPWWNGAVEDQCINRAHRIGQNARVVRVRKFVVHDTVEESIAELQRRKRAMAGQVLNGDNETTHGADLTLEDFKLIFGN